MNVGYELTLKVQANRLKDTANSELLPEAEDRRSPLEGRAAALLAEERRPSCDTVEIS